MYFILHQHIEKATQNIQLKLGMLVPLLYFNQQVILIKLNLGVFFSKIIFLYACTLLAYAKSVSCGSMWTVRSG